MAFKINNPFTNKDERSDSGFESLMPQSWRDERAAFNTEIDERLGEIKKIEENLVKRRGKTSYRDTMEKKRINDQPVFTNSKEKKYPYLMSVYNFKPTGGTGPSLPWQCDEDPTSPRNQYVGTCKRWHEDNYNRTWSLAGTERGVLKDMEHDAKLSSEIMEQALALDYTEENYVKNLLALVNNRISDFKLGGSRVENNTKNVAWQTKQQVLKMIKDHEEAVAAQDAEDNKRIMQWELQQSKNNLDDMFNEDGSVNFNL